VVGVDLPDALAWPRLHPALAAADAASYPVFLLLYAKVMLAPRHHAPRYALGMIAMSLVLLPWYPSG
jgi:hypothetical protein